MATLCFVSPNQLISESRLRGEYEGFTLMIHPDFIRPYPLGKTIKNYGFFAYSSNEALQLSEKEKETIMGVFKSIGDELALPIDQYNQDVIVSQIELLLNYNILLCNVLFIPSARKSHVLLPRHRHDARRA